MISRDLLALVRCPVCVRIEPSLACGPTCPALAEAPAAAGDDHAACAARYGLLDRCDCGAVDKVILERVDERALDCPCCGTRYRIDAADTFIDLTPTFEGFIEQTKYLDQALHVDGRHESVTVPLLSAKVRNDMLRSFLRPSAGDRVLDLGCGSGRALVWNAGRTPHLIGVDAAAYFAEEARRDAALVVGDLRRLPFAARSFDKAFSLDVLEHLSPESLDRVLAEARRTLKPGGLLFVYSHARQNSRLAGLLHLINRLARALESAGAVDLSRERLRKSDHLNPIASFAQLRALVARHGFAIRRVRFYTPVIGAFVENIFVRAAEQRLARRMSTSAPAGVGLDPRPRTRGEGPASDAVRQARLEAKRRIARRGPAYMLLAALSALMKIDVWLFGRIVSGPFFVLLEKKSTASGTPLQ